MPIAHATPIEVPVTTIKPSGTIQSSLIFCGLSEKATLLKTKGRAQSWVRTKARALETGAGAGTHGDTV